jgi:hypothetical protein
MLGIKPHVRVGALQRPVANQIDLLIQAAQIAEVGRHGNRKAAAQRS